MRSFTAGSHPSIDVAHLCCLSDQWEAASLGYLRGLGIPPAISPPSLAPRSHARFSIRWMWMAIALGLRVWRCWPPPSDVWHRSSPSTWPGVAWLYVALQVSMQSGSLTHACIAHQCPPPSVGPSDCTICPHPPHAKLPHPTPFLWYENRWERKAIVQVVFLPTPLSGPCSGCFIVSPLREPLAHASRRFFCATIALLPPLV